MCGEYIHACNNNDKILMKKSYDVRRYSGFQAGWATLSDNYITSDWANDDKS